MRWRERTKHIIDLSSWFTQFFFSVEREQSSENVKLLYVSMEGFEYSKDWAKISVSESVSKHVGRLFSFPRTASSPVLWVLPCVLGDVFWPCSYLFSKLIPEVQHLNSFCGEQIETSDLELSEQGFEPDPNLSPCWASTYPWAGTHTKFSQSNIQIIFVLIKNGAQSTNMMAEAFLLEIAKIW